MAGLVRTVPLIFASVRCWVTRLRISLGSGVVCVFSRMAPNDTNAINAHAEMKRVCCRTDFLNSTAVEQMQSMKNHNNGGVSKLYWAMMPVMKPAATMARGLRKRKYSLRDALRSR